MALEPWQEGEHFIKDVPGCSNCFVPTLQGSEVLVARVLQMASYFVGVIVFIMLIYGSVLWMIAGGDDQKIATAQKTITYAIIGLVLLVSSILILNVIESITGVNISVFRIHFAN